MQPLDYTTMDFKGLDCLPLPSSSRAMRNLAEKQRRDKLNAYISELAALVPSVASAARKLDKTSILRLSANFLRIHQNLEVDAEFDSRPPLSQKRSDVGHTLLEKEVETQTEDCRDYVSTAEKALFEDLTKSCVLRPHIAQLLKWGSLGAFLLVISTSGKIVYVSEGAEKVLGHAQVDMMGLPIYCFVHQEDHSVVKRQLTGYGQGFGARGGRGGRCSMEIRMTGRSMGRGEPVNYERIHITGKFRPPASKRRTMSSPSADTESLGSSSVYPTDTLLGNESDHTKLACASISNSRLTPTETLLVAVARLIPHKIPNASLTILESMQDEYITRHLLDGTITQTDHRISIVAGYFPEEVVGKQALSYIFAEELPFSVVTQRIMLTNPEKEGFVTYRLVTRTGKLIYLRSRGFVEIDQVTQQVISFVCVNSQIDEEQGAKEVQQIKEMILSLNLSVPDVNPLGNEMNHSSPLPMLSPAQHHQPSCSSSKSHGYTVSESQNGNNPPAFDSVSAVPRPLLTPVALPETNVVSTYVHRASMTGGNTCTSDAYCVLQSSQMSNSATAGYPSSFAFNQQPSEPDIRVSRDSHSSDSNDSFCSECADCMRCTSACTEAKKEEHVNSELSTMTSVAGDVPLTRSANSSSSHANVLGALVIRSGDPESDSKKLRSILDYDSLVSDSRPGPIYGFAKRKKYLPCVDIRSLQDHCENDDSWLPSPPTKSSSGEDVFLHTLFSQRQTCVYQSNSKTETLMNGTGRLDNA